MILPSGESRYHITLHTKSIQRPILYMLHGFMGSGEIFDHLIPALVKSFTPVTIDLAGHGRTYTPADPAHFDTELQVVQLHSVFRRFGTRKYYLYGYSMGGRLALQYAARYPGQLSGLCIESAHCGIESRDKRAERRQTDSDRALLLKENYSRFTAEWSRLPLFSSTPESFRKLYLQIAAAQNPDCMAASLRGFGAGVMPAMCEKLKTLNFPLLYLAGEADKKYVQMMKNMQERTPFSELVTVPAAGHRVHTDRPESVLQVLRRLAGTGVSN